MSKHTEGPGGSGEAARGLSTKNLDAQAILKTMHQPLLVLDCDFIVQGANRAFYHTFEVEPDDTEGVAIFELGNGQWDIPSLRELLTDILPSAGTVEDFLVEHRFETIGRRIMKINARQIPERNPDLILLAIDDITGQEVARREMEAQKKLLEMTLDAAPASFLILGKDLRVIKANDTFYDTFEINREETEGRLVYELGNDQWDIPKLRELLEDVLPDNDTFDGFEVEHDFEEIGHRVMVLNARRINHHQLILLAIDDITEKRAGEREQKEKAVRRSFILDLLDRLRGEKDPEVLLVRACEALGERLGADQVVYADIDVSDGHRILPHLWSSGPVPEPIRSRRVEDFGRPLLDDLKAGRTIVVHDVHEDARTEAAGLAASFDEIAVASLVEVPLIEQGQLRAIFGVHVTRPRRWMPADVKLTEEVAERLWDAVAICRAEAESRASEADLRASEAELRVSEAELRASEAELRVSVERFRVLVETGAQATWEAGPDGMRRDASASWSAYTGQTVRASLGEGWLDAVHPDDRQAVADRWRQSVQAEEPLSDEFRLRHGDAWRWTQVRAAPVRDDQDRIVRWVGVNHDITDRKESEKRIEHMALYDALTELPNRVLLQDRFREALARTHRGSGDLGLIMLDIDRFKEVNDLVGHAGGDMLLRCVAKRVSGALRGSDTFARLSGDEFAAVLPNVGGSVEIEHLVERVRDAVSRPLALGTHSVEPSVSMGIALCPQDGDELEPLLHCADVALYRAKAERRGTFRFFEPEMEAQAQRQRRTETDLRTALERDELTLFYQPQLDVSDVRIRSVEALVRWRHPTRGLLLPGEFIPLAEATGMIRSLGNWVLGEACRQVREWRDHGLDLRVGVNLSSAEARGGNVLETLDQAFSDCSLGENDVEFEITESLLVDPTDEPMAALLSGLRARGVGVAVDDFGTGYSSLSYLKDLPIDTIKMDRSFVAATDAEDGRTLLAAMIDLGQKLGKRVIAEGVETADQLSWLGGTGCDAVQGYWIARPLPPEQIPMSVA